MIRKTLLALSILGLTACGQSTTPQAATPAAPAEPPKPQHHYVLKEGMQYGYESGISNTAAKDGQVASKIMMVRFAGEQDGRLQAFAQEKDVYTVLECERPCEFVKLMTFFGSRNIKTERIRANPGSVANAVMADAMAGELERSTLKGTPPFTVWFDEHRGMIKTRLPAGEKTAS
jgi:hypothetical protein